MPLRHVVLAAMAVAVLAMGVYLFVQVRSTPAQAQGQPAHTDPKGDISPATPAHTTPNIAARPPVDVHGANHPTAPEQAPELASDDSDPASERANPKIEAVMDQANKAYDRQDFEDAKAIAGKVLSKQPTNIRMLRIMVSSACIEGDMPTAQKYYEQLPKADREQMKQRCDKYGSSFKEPAQ